MPTTEAVVGLAVSISALIGVVVAFWKWALPRYRSAKARGTAALDSLVGRDAVVDSITGRELAPALPGIGQRMDVVEQTLVKLADQHSRIDDHERRLTTLESATVERAITRAESLQHLSTLDEAVRRIPGDGGAS